MSLHSPAPAVSATTRCDSMTRSLDLRCGVIFMTHTLANTAVIVADLIDVVRRFMPYVLTVSTGRRAQTVHRVSTGGFDGR